MFPDLVNEINAVEGVLWTAGKNKRFNDQPLSSLKSLCGVTPDSHAEVQKLPKAKFTGRVADLPADFDSETNWPDCAKVIGDIRDQSMCGCCWAFGAASAASDRLCIASNASIQVPLSAQDICFCASFDGCSGGQITTPWNHIARAGAVSGGQVNSTGPFGGGFCSEFSLPHCHHHGPQGADPYPAEGTPGCESQSSPQCPKKCDGGAKAPHDQFSDDKYTFTGGTQQASGEQGIMQAIKEGGPVETAFTVYTDFANYVSGIETALDMIQESLPRTFVNLVTMVDVGSLYDISGPDIGCLAVRPVVCSRGSNRERSAEEAAAYQRGLSELVLGSKYQSDTFTVVLQPWYTNFEVIGNVDRSYLAPDCFHYSIPAMEFASLATWNNLFQRVGE